MRIGAQVMEADWIVVAAGVWTAALTATLGLELPVQARAPQMLLTTPAVPQLAPTLSAAGRALSLKQLPTGEFFIGGGWPTTIVQNGENLSCQVQPASVEGSWGVATEIVPAVAEQRISQSWGGLEAESIDGVPFIGPLGDVDGLLVAVGFSGHGFQLAPAVGRAVAAMLGGASVPEQAPVAATRIRDFGQLDVAAFRRRPTAEPLHAIQ